MASRKAHIATGWAAGVMAAAMVSHAGTAGPYYVWAILAVLAGMFGGTGPDWLETRWYSGKKGLWIKHRTLTHWGIPWVAALIYSYYALPLHPAAAIALGYTAGGVMHLLSDWPNHMGVPWVYQRVSLRLWASGEFDFVVVGLAWIAAIALGDAMWFHGVHLQHVYAFLRALPLFYMHAQA